MPTVLVVEDEANVRKLVQVNLASRGYQVIEAHNGKQALDQLRDSPPSLMVLDIKLPDFTGWDILKKMSSDPEIEADLPVLVMTASITDAHLDRDQYPNVVEVIVKPFSTRELLAAVEHALLQAGKGIETHGSDSGSGRPSPDSEAGQS
jgi:CheY-like chemotaxis protein